MFDAIRREIADEYAQPHDKPWIVGFSGGKDSTLVAHLVVEHLLSLPRSDRTRPVHIVANDTLVESPLVIGHIREGLTEIDRASTAFELPIAVATTRPDATQTFWINLIGRGYPSPNRSFRWCTDRMKIQPTSQYIRNQVSLAGEVILLLGVRRSESATRAGVVSRYDNGERLNGAAPKLMILDEVAQWPGTQIDAMLAALTTSRGKIRTLKRYGLERGRRPRNTLLK